MYRVAIIFALSCGLTVAQTCNPSVTTASGSFAPTEICSGAIIFQEEFDALNFQKWQHESTLGGGGVSIEFKKNNIVLCCFYCHF